MDTPPSPLRFGSYRKYPSSGDRQAPFEDERDVCAHCLSGACCSSEGPIALTSFDILRLAAFFDMSPADFLATFTQDRFDGENSDERRRPWIDSPGSSVVTFLRRRANYPTSPCIFLKYIHDGDKTPRRVCSVHPARPLACREYYYDTCKKRVTGELAVVLSQGLEMVRQGKITTELLESNRKRLQPAKDGESLATKWQYAFWSEMRRALDIEQANNEGANSYPITEYQDPLDEKLSRLLSKRHLRFEEKYGPRPHGEQLQPYSAGLSFKGSPDYERILRIVRTAPTAGLFEDQDYPHDVGMRTLMPGVRLAADFGRARVRTTRGGPYAGAIVRGWNFLLGLAAHAAHTEHLIETEPWGAFELALLEALLPFDSALQRRVAGTTCLRGAQQWAGAVASQVLQETHRSLAASAAGPKAWLQFYASVARLVSGTPPRALGRLVRMLRLEAARRPAARQRRGFERQLRPLGPRTPELGNKLIERIAYLRGLAVLGSSRQSNRIHAAVSQCLDLLPFCESQPAGAFEALDAFARGGPLWPPPLRRRAADLAFRWAMRADAEAPWEGQPLLRWAGVCARLGIAGAGTPGFSRSIAHILSSQSPDGSWATDLQPERLPEWQGAYQRGAVHLTSAAVEGLCAALNPGF